VPELEAFFADTDGWRSFRTGELFGSTGPPPDPVFVLGETKPSASNSGLIAPTTSTRTGTTINIDIGGTASVPVVYDSVLFLGNVNVRAPYVTFRNCEFRGAPGGTGLAGTTGERGVINVTNQVCVGVRFEHCKIRPDVAESNWNGGVFGHDFTVYRCYFTSNEDSIGVYNSNTANPGNVTVEGCYFENYTYHCPNLNASDNKSHNDHIQTHSANSSRNLRVFGNTFEGFIDVPRSDYSAPVYDGNGDIVSGYPHFGVGLWGFSCLMFAPGSGTLTNVQIEKNWINGGTVGINLGVYTGASGLRIVGNRIGRNFEEGETALVVKASGMHISGGSNSLAGNVYEDDGSPWTQGPFSGTWP
jgi:hypothetical protein